jgi:hypothetical protein
MCFGFVSWWLSSRAQRTISGVPWESRVAGSRRLCWVGVRVVDKHIAMLHVVQMTNKLGERKMTDKYKYRIVIDGEVSDEIVNEFQELGIDFFRIVRKGRRVVTKTSVLDDTDVPQMILESRGVENRVEELLWTDALNGLDCRV